jgi:ADP-heptose:LPS heptosyltransferase
MVGRGDEEIPGEGPHGVDTGPDTGGAAVIGMGVGPVLEKFKDVTKIAVLRGGGLGDLLFALPAAAALKRAYPEATLTLLGTPVHAALVSGAATPVDRVCLLPFIEGVRPGREDPGAVTDFRLRMQAETFDLAVQLHGGGRYSNPFLLSLGARHTVGTRTPDAERLERSVPYAFYQHEPLRALEIAGFAGAEPVGLEARVEPRSEYAARAEKLVRRGAEGIVALHPGATDPRRRWPARCFAELARACAADGFQVVVVGDGSEVPLANEILEAAGGARPGNNLVSLAGELDVGTLTAFLARCAVVVGNDSGPRHLAQALGTPTVGLYWSGNVINAGPLGRALHRLHISWVTRCPVCEADVTQVGWTAGRCPHEWSLLEGIRSEAVHADVRALTAMKPPLRGR